MPPLLVDWRGHWGLIRWQTRWCRHVSGDRSRGRSSLLLPERLGVHRRRLYVGGGGHVVRLTAERGVLGGYLETRRLLPQSIQRTEVCMRLSRTVSHCDAWIRCSHMTELVWQMGLRVQPRVVVERLKIKPCLREGDNVLLGGDA